MQWPLWIEQEFGWWYLPLLIEWHIPLFHHRTMDSPGRILKGEGHMNTIESETRRAGVSLLVHRPRESSINKVYPPKAQEQKRQLGTLLAPGGTSGFAPWNFNNSYKSLRDGVTHYSYGEVLLPGSGTQNGAAAIFTNPMGCIGNMLLNEMKWINEFQSC